MAELGISGKRIRKKPKYLRDDEDEEESTAKQHKSSKSKKAKKNREKPEKRSSKEKQGIKLKIKLGGAHIVKNSVVTKTTDYLQEIEQPDGDESDNIDIEGEAISSASDFIIDEQDSTNGEILTSYISDENTQTSQLTSTQSADGHETSDEEREWLEAIESGDIEDYEKKKAEKNPAMLTARQRRILHGEEEEQLMELPTLYKNKTLTEEQLNIRKQRAVKRRQQALEKNEKAKKQTVDRLLKKSDNSTSKTKSRAVKQAFPHVRYLSTEKSITLSYPCNITSPMTRQVALEPPNPTLCGADGCTNQKRYTCSKTLLPICSLLCYKKVTAASMLSVT